MRTSAYQNAHAHKFFHFKSTRNFTLSQKKENFVNSTVALGTNAFHFVEPPMVSPNRDAELEARVKLNDRVHADLSRREQALLVRISAFRAQLAAQTHATGEIIAEGEALWAEAGVLNTDSNALFAAMAAVNVELRGEG